MDLSAHTLSPPVSYLIPWAALYRFLQTYAGPASELPSSDNEHEIPAEQNDMPADAPLSLIPAESLSQFLHLYEISPEPSSFGHDTPAVQQLDAQLNQATAPIPYKCSVCERTFDRKQERNRHVESYLPHSVHCPFPGCTWTGRRQSDFKRHWGREHLESGQAPGEGESEIYDPRDFVNLIVDGTPVEEVARYAFAKVRESLGRQGRPDVLANVLGRNRDLKKWICIPSSQLN